MDAPNTVASVVRPSVGDVIDRLGVGPLLVKETILGGSVWLVGGAQLIVVTVTTQSIAERWALQGWQRSSTVAVVFVGILLGDIVGGPFTDMVGRRLPIIVSYALVFFCGIGNAYALGFISLCTFRLLLGLAFGLQQPAWQSLCSEITPPKWRMVSAVASGTLFIVGEVYAVIIVWFDDPSLKDLDWRWIMVKVSAPAAIFGMASMLFLTESPSWLALQGETAKAEQILQSIRWWNGKEHEPVDFCAPVLARCQGDMHSMKQQLHVAFSPTMRFATCVMCFSCFALNLLYYGGFYAFPLVFGDVDMGVSRAVAILFGALWEFPGYLWTLLFDAFCGRRLSTLAYLLFSAASVIMFVLAAEQKRGDGMVIHVLLHAGFAGVKCWVNMGFCIVYQYASEIYPTSARGMCTGICLGCGRIGSILAPFIFEGITSIFPWSVFFHAMIVVCVINAIGIAMLPFETHGMVLSDHVDEVKEVEPLLVCHNRKV